MSKAKSADLILKLYDLRREAKMREARNWVFGFFPQSADEVLKAMIAEESSANFRMVVTYWDMAASLVNHGAIDEEMFNDSAGESVAIFAKIEPFLEEIRIKMGSPKFLKNLEKLIMKQSNAKEMLAQRREMLQRMMQARAEMSKTA
jgi:phage terminase large subunit-like protein